MIKPIKNDALSRGYDKRYVVVNTTTGEVVDDARGSGFRSGGKAIRCWDYKNSSFGQLKMRLEKEERKRKREARLKANQKRKRVKARIMQKRKKEGQRDA